MQVLFTCPTIVNDHQDAAAFMPSDNAVSLVINITKVKHA